MNNNYSRRKFIKTAVVSAGAVGATGLAGCGGDSRNVADGTVEITSVDTVGTRFPQSVASGDPRPSSIILWTRVSAGIGEATVTVQVATDENFSNIVVSADLSATISNDHCIKVKITDLARYTRYYYRFVHEGVSSRTGRFKTAPATGADEDVKFGFVSCQDYTNGYYNSLLKLLEEDNDDIDFIVHLGDYIYETTGDSFQGSARSVSFSDESGAINTGESLAAASVSNYRDLYKQYRSDEILQRVHEMFPFIVIWDDHEFSDDAWQDVGTYFDEQQDEQNTQRKRNAEQAFFEFQPIDIDPSTGNLLSDGQVTVDGDSLYPSSLYRAFRYGRKLNLILSDYRTYRPDHLIPEDSHPGSVVVSELGVGQTLWALVQRGTLSTCDPGDPLFGGANDQLVGAFQALGDSPNAAQLQATAHAVAPGLGLLQYIDLSEAGNAAYQQYVTAALTQQYIGAGIDNATAAAKATEVASGRFAVAFINGMLQVSNPFGLPLLNSADFEYGIAYALLGRDQNSLFSTSGLGSRYLVVKNTFDLYTAYLSLIAGNTDYDNAWGDAQTQAILISLISSTATWNVLGSSTSFTSMVLDNSIDSCTGQPSSLRTLVASLTGGNANDPNDANIPLPNAQFYLNVDQWDGFPIRRTVLMDNTQDPDTGEDLLPTTLKDSNTVIISGDIHAKFVTDHGASSSGGRCVEFTCPAVSSGTIGAFVTANVATILAGGDPDDIGVAELTGASIISGGNGVNWNGLAQAFSDANSGIVDADESTNGVVVVELKTVDQEEVMDVTYHEFETGVIQGSLTALIANDDYSNNLLTSHYNDQSSLSFNSTTYRVTKSSGNNGSPTEL